MKSAVFLFLGIAITANAQTLPDTQIVPTVIPSSIPKSALKPEFQDSDRVICINPSTNPDLPPQYSCFGVKNSDPASVQTARQWVSQIGGTAPAFLLPSANSPSKDSFAELKRWPRIKKAAFRSFSFQVVNIGALMLAPPEYTHWENGIGYEMIHNAGPHLKQAWTSLPVWDHDDWHTNFIFHPYAGSLHYNMIRNLGGSATESLLYSVFFSTVGWEYGLEAMFERPSIQDLVMTPLGGALLGEGAHQLTLAMAKRGFTPLEKIAVIVINPTYVLNHGFKTPNEVRRKQLKQFSY